MRDLRPRRVALGYVAASWILTGAAWGGSKLAELLPATDLGLLGVIPLGIGIRRAWELRQAPPAPGTSAPVAAGVVTAASLTLAQGADNFLVYTSLFADSKNGLDLHVFIALAACAAGWCACAFWLARHSPLAGVLRRAMRFALPFLLIAVGIYMLSDTVTDVIELAVRV